MVTMMMRPIGEKFEREGERKLRNQKEPVPSCEL
jgi:hypothetical protein